MKKILMLITVGCFVGFAMMKIMETNQVVVETKVRTNDIEESIQRLDKRLDEMTEAVDGLSEAVYRLVDKAGV